MSTDAIAQPSGCGCNRRHVGYHDALFLLGALAHQALPYLEPLRDVFPFVDGVTGESVSTEVSSMVSAT